MLVEIFQNVNVRYCCFMLFGTQNMKSGTVRALVVVVCNFTFWIWTATDFWSWEDFVGSFFFSFKKNAGFGLEIDSFKVTYFELELLVDENIIFIFEVGKYDDFSDRIECGIFNIKYVPKIH